MNTFDAPDESWWYMCACVKLGPVATERLQQLHATGQIDDDTLVWRCDGSLMSSAWRPLRAVMAARRPL